MASTEESSLLKSMIFAAYSLPVSFSIHLLTVEDMPLQWVHRDKMKENKEQTLSLPFGFWPFLSLIYKEITLWQHNPKMY